MKDKEAGAFISFVIIVHTRHYAIQASSHSMIILCQSPILCRASFTSSCVWEQRSSVSTWTLIAKIGYLRPPYNDSFCKASKGMAEISNETPAAVGLDPHLYQLTI